VPQSASGKAFLKLVEKFNNTQEIATASTGLLTCCEVAKPET